MRISIRCALILSFAALIDFWRERCLNRTSATTPKMPLAITSAGPRPRSSSGHNNTSNTREIPWSRAFIVSAERSMCGRRCARGDHSLGASGSGIHRADARGVRLRSGDVAETLQLLGDLRVTLRALEL